MTLEEADGAIRPRVSTVQRGLELIDIRTVFDPSSAAVRTLRAVLEPGRESSIAWIALPSPSGELLIEYVHGESTPLLQHLWVPAGRGLTGKVFQRGAVDFVEQYVAATTITHDFDTVIEAEAVVRMLAAPLQAGDETVGVLTLATRSAGVFGDGEIARVEDLARQAGVALEIARQTRLRAEAAAAAERLRISEDLHDGLAALLFSISSRADRLQGRITDGDLADDVRALQRDVGRATRDLRAFIGGWRESAVGDLHVELLNDCTAFEHRTGVRCHLACLGPVERVEGISADVAVRFVREALLNVEKHAGATSVSVTVAAMPAELTIAVADDGRGFPADRSGGGFGLTAARERIARIGGELSVVDDEGGGSIVRVRLPR